MPAAYPIDFPFIEATEAVSIIRSGNVAANKDKLGLDLWWIQGYAQAMFIGNPTAQSAENAEFDGLEVLTKLNKSVESGQVAAQLAVDWKALAKWAAQLLLELLLKESLS